MTEEEWLKATDPELMLTNASGRASERKQRLFAVACCRCIWRLLPDEDTRNSVLIAERYAEGLVGQKEATSAWFDALTTVLPLPIATPARLAAIAASFAVGEVSTLNLVASHAAWAVGERAAEMAAVQTTLLRDILGLILFRSVPIIQSWLFWNDATVPRIARSIYDDRRFDELPILADALEEAGCSDPDILGHCRGPGPHVRGCWVVDLILGRS